MDNSLILQNSKAEVNLEGINDSKSKFQSQNSQTQVQNSSKINSKIFSISGSDESFYSENKRQDEKENIRNGIKGAKHIKQSKSSGYIISQRPTDINQQHTYTQLSHNNHINVDFNIDEMKEKEAMEDEAKESIMSMYSNNKISKKDILDNILEVEQENTGPQHLNNIAYKLQKKLEEKAEKLKSLRISQQFDNSAIFKQEQEIQDLDCYELENSQNIHTEDDQSYYSIEGEGEEEEEEEEIDSS
eukprot:CAMPEP_0205802630 /NCGR_PEP_ID=MMETSP0205-20121125/5021_1 /ASSEMBLY_ACC=CAM_ASM_000278 /TAXON_ID=36767 /ORGANISM="Euplotes focardii, Strain TN1" /LENGTH=244 /DNA_ID=CAMNT_0053069375 /DNA_START=405 /DNA_END=1135 /DNA_ORIENTATION=-